MMAQNRIHDRTTNSVLFSYQSTTIILWVPLIFMSLVEMVFSFRCFAVCSSFLYLCPCRRKPSQTRKVRPLTAPVFGS